MENHNFEWNNNCNETNELYADILSENENDTDESYDSDFPINIKRKILNVESDSETSDLDDIKFKNEDNNSTTYWCENDGDININLFLGNDGVKVFPRNPENISDAIDLFIDDDFFKLLTNETNRYYMQNMLKYKFVNKIKQWKDTTIPEMKKFLGLNILMGQVRKNSINDYWSTDLMIETPIFGKVMPRNRFRQILQSLHFCNNDEMLENTDRLFKIEPVMEYFLNKFYTVYKPKQNLSLDEAMIPYRGRLSFRVYNPEKITKNGMLLRMLCESESGYITNFKFYSASEQKLQNLVNNLLDKYEDIWHHVYMDNYYNSVELAEHLLSRKIRICGTIREYHRLLPDIKKIKLRRGQHVFHRKNEILIHVWKEKKYFGMISTIHQARLIETGNINRKTGEMIRKPENIIDYNMYMNGVDLADKYLFYNPIINKSVKWTKKAFMFMLNCALFNSFVVYKKLNPVKKIKFTSYLLQVAKGWIESTDNVCSEVSGGPSKRASCKDPPTRLSGDIKTHRLVKLHSTGKKKFPQKRCKVCKNHGKRKETCFMCGDCEIPLCVGKCFEDYHIKRNY